MYILPKPLAQLSPVIIKFWSFSFAAGFKRLNTLFTYFVAAIPFRAGVFGKFILIGSNNFAGVDRFVVIDLWNCSPNDKPRIEKSVSFRNGDTILPNFISIFEFDLTFRPCWFNLIIFDVEPKSKLLDTGKDPLATIGVADWLLMFGNWFSNPGNFSVNKIISLTRKWIVAWPHRKLYRRSYVL